MKETLDSIIIRCKDTIKSVEQSIIDQQSVIDFTNPLGAESFKHESMTATGLTMMLHVRNEKTQIVNKLNILKDALSVLEILRQVHPEDNELSNRQMNVILGFYSSKL